MTLNVSTLNIVESCLAVGLWVLMLNGLITRTVGHDSPMARNSSSDTRHWPTIIHSKAVMSDTINTNGKASVARAKTVPRSGSM